MYYVKKQPKKCLYVIQIDHTKHSVLANTCIIYTTSEIVCLHFFKILMGRK